MSNSKYTADISKGCSKSSGGSQRAFRWPDEIPTLGRRTIGAFSRCAFCPPSLHICIAGTFVAYGATPLCEACAIGEAARRAA